MERITMEDVHRIAATISEALDSEYWIQTQRRNGYCAADLCRDAGTVVETLHLGTAREVYEYLRGFRKALLVVEHS